ncbi:MAG: hypothetical protein HYS22_04075 [Deltaproteobacteria bacterium]|nr:hypothetical protein [Deltaproteobacteria bacterium]
MLKKPVVVLMLVLFSGCVPSRSSQRSQGPTKISGPSGYMMTPYGITIEARYEPSLDQLMPGYKIVIVSLTNNSMDPIPMDAIKDKWVIETLNGRKLKATNSLRLKDPKVWSDLPKEKKSLMEYPHTVPIGYTQTFDIFIRGNPNLEDFHAVTYKNEAMGMIFEILTSE